MDRKLQAGEKKHLRVLFFRHVVTFNAGVTPSVFPLLRLVGNRLVGGAGAAWSTDRSAYCWNARSSIAIAV
ncbi:MAG: hypothetical protein EAZ24_10830 [Burkholderiales bacterium]|nr:MAG: hypothetical protein EAZ24_10830 [Burkholderiales bacterium]